MKTRNLLSAAICTLFLASAFTLTSWSTPQDTSSGTILVKTVVSVEASNGKDVPDIHREDVRAFLNRVRVPVNDWIPLRGDQAGLELFVLIDESLNQNIALRFDEMRQFMNAQPATTLIGVGYMRNGGVQTVQNLTADHSLAAKALRLPIGPVAGIGSPYLSLSDLLKRWPDSPNRHAVLMISDGIDEWQYGFNPPYLDAAVDRAEQMGVQVYSIYARGMGHYAHSMFRMNWGQNNLSELTELTGGEAYFQGFETPINFTPYLDQFANRLNHQYRLTVPAMPGKKPTYQSIRLETEVSNAELITADKIYVPAAK